MKPGPHGESQRRHGEQHDRRRPPVRGRHTFRHRRHDGRPAEQPREELLGSHHRRVHLAPRRQGFVAHEVGRRLRQRGRRDPSEPRGQWSGQLREHQHHTRRRGRGARAVDDAARRVPRGGPASTLAVSPPRNTATRSATATSATTEVTSTAAHPASTCGAPKARAPPNSPGHAPAPHVGGGPPRTVAPARAPPNIPGLAPALHVGGGLPRTVAPARAPPNSAGLAPALHVGGGLPRTVAPARAPPNSAGLAPAPHDGGGPPRACAPAVNVSGGRAAASAAPAPESPSARQHRGRHEQQHGHPTGRQRGRAPRRAGAQHSEPRQQHGRARPAQRPRVLGSPQPAGARGAGRDRDP
ncbi:hypothetical protein ABZU76_34790 [Amycolatopsis sp. NPDC005232]|uniref:hypothetical protein n=1 Tax=Amycolatopsis sp. NPDC005232 TaxID=3157027 RepID=UPI0033AD658F